MLSLPKGIDNSLGNMLQVQSLPQRPYTQFFGPQDSSGEGYRAHFQGRLASGKESHLQNSKGSKEPPPEFSWLLSFL